VIFKDSTKGSEYQTKHPRRFKFLDDKDFDGNTYPNAPQSFGSTKPSSQQGSSSGHSNPHKGPHKGNLLDDLHDVAL
jgi:hypothetical protein